MNSQSQELGWHEITVQFIFLFPTQNTHTFMHMHKLMYTHTLLPAKTPLQMYTHTYAHSYTLTVLICMNAGMCRNEDGWDSHPLHHCACGILQIVLGSRRNRNPDTRSLVLSHCTALCWIMLVAKAFNPLGQVSSPARWRWRGLNPLGVKHNSLTNMSNGFRVWRAQGQTPASSEAFPSFGSSVFLFCYSGEPCQPVGLSGD